MKKSNIYWNIDYRLNKRILSYLADLSIHRQIMLSHKGTKSETSSDPPCKDHARSTMVPMKAMSDQV